MLLNQRTNQATADRCRCFSLLRRGLGFRGLEGAGEGGHFDGCIGGLSTLVTQGTASAVESLLLVVGGEHAEDDRHLLCGIEIGAALCGIVADIVEVRRSATNHTANHDDSVEASYARQLGGSIGEFDCAGNGIDVHCIVGIT